MSDETLAAVSDLFSDEEPEPAAEGATAFANMLDVVGRPTCPAHADDEEVEHARTPRRRDLEKERGMIE